MPFLKIPGPQGSIKPFFATVQRHLLAEIAKKQQFEPESGFPVKLHNFAKNINLDTITIESLFSRAGELDKEDIGLILNILSVYLTQTSNYGANVLMFAAGRGPNAITSILAAMAYLTPDQQAEILRQVTRTSGDNVLMLVVNSNKSQGLDSILSRISTLSPEQKAQILLMRNMKGKTVLDLVTGHFDGKPHPSYASIKAAIDSIPLEASDTPVLSCSSSAVAASSSALASSSTGFFHHPNTSSSTKAAPHKKNRFIQFLDNIFADTSTKTINKELLDFARDRLDKYFNGVSNVLLNPTREHSEEVEQIIKDIDEKIIDIRDVIVKLDHIPNVKPEESLAKRIRQIRRHCFNKLPLCYHNNPLWLIGFQPLETVVAEINKLHDIGVLSRTDQDGWNALAMAARFQPEVVGPLLGVINPLHNDTLKTTILGQTTKSGWNALVIAARYQPEVVSPLLEAISSLHYDAIKTSILGQTTNDGWNVLMSAVHYHPMVLEPLLEALNSLPTVKAVMLKQCHANNEVIPAGHNALMLAAAYKPEAIESILLAITTLDIEDQIDIFSKTNKQGNNALQLAVNNHHSHAMALIIQVMETLKLSTNTTPAAPSPGSSMQLILDREEMEPFDNEYRSVY